ncbi:Uma2 family endonuclease [Streptomyces sp. NPDC055721]|uniref:Uma2 family endonuclease n=1 Tax=Streptomyces sp. NPDC127132 TaxID=3345374 RepID=UPI00362EEBF8
MTTVEQIFELYSAQEPEGWRVELVEGEICVTSVNDGQHAQIVADLRDQLTDPDRQLSAYTGIGLRVPPRGPGGPGERVEGRVVPDLTLALRGSFRNELVWQKPAPVLLVAEVTSSFTAHRDRAQKVGAYARAGIPVYLLIDREAGEAVVRSEPSGDEYGRTAVHRLGTPVCLPAPVSRTWETTEL